MKRQGESGRWALHLWELVNLNVVGRVIRKMLSI